MTAEPDEDEDACGYTYDHVERYLGDGHWECTRCGAEGWDEDEEESE